jgi:hypothetical protein
LHEPLREERKTLWKDVWRIASQEPCVKEELDKSPQEKKDFRALARGIAHDQFHAEIRPLKALKEQSEK